ncbi:hypothetical protein TNCV_2961091 [Trichonephila clavipes]|nr:hypothetical protein TNCV_2961091 [Trichonephila clavipes]
MVKIEDLWLASHEFEPSATETLLYRVGPLHIKCVEARLPIGVEVRRVIPIYNENNNEIDTESNEGTGTETNKKVKTLKSSNTPQSTPSPSFRRVHKAGQTPRTKSIPSRAHTSSQVTRSKSRELRLLFAPETSHYLINIIIFDTCVKIGQGRHTATTSVQDRNLSLRARRHRRTMAPQLAPDLAAVCPKDKFPGKQTTDI